MANFLRPEVRRLYSVVDVIGHVTVHVHVDMYNALASSYSPGCIPHYIHAHPR